MNKLKKLPLRAARKLRRIIVRWLIHDIHSTHYCYGQHPITWGEGCGLANTIFNTRSGSIQLGKNVIFGHNCMVITGVHSPDTVDQFRPTESAGRDITIGDNVFIGSGAIILGPVIIEKNAVVAAGSIVVHPVAANTLVAGNPARPIRTVGQRMS